MTNKSCYGQTCNGHQTGSSSRLLQTSADQKNYQLVGAQNIFLAQMQFIMAIYYGQVSNFSKVQTTDKVQTTGPGHYLMLTVAASVVAQRTTSRVMPKQTLGSITRQKCLGSECVSMSFLNGRTKNSKNQ